MTAPYVGITQIRFAGRSYRFLSACLRKLPSSQSYESNCILPHLSAKRKRQFEAGPGKHLSNYPKLSQFFSAYIRPFPSVFLVFHAAVCYTAAMKKYQIIRSRRKTLALEVTEDCRVVVRAPCTLSRAQIDACVESHTAWIENHLKIQQERASIRPPAPTEKEIAALKARAQSVLPPLVALWSEKMGVSPTGFRITAARRRYGSCSAKNSLCFSCFLVNCPEAAIELVVVHELCHIREKNHGPGFYALLGHYLPDYKERRKLLH